MERKEFEALLEEAFIAGYAEASRAAIRAQINAINQQKLANGEITKDELYKFSNLRAKRKMAIARREENYRKRMEEKEAERRKQAEKTPISVIVKSKYKDKINSLVHKFKNMKPIGDRPLAID